MSTAVLFCSKCHTRWVEAVLRAWQKCPFKDCAGELSPTPPPGAIKAKAPKPPREWPILEAAERSE